MSGLYELRERFALGAWRENPNDPEKAFRCAEERYRRHLGRELSNGEIDSLNKLLDIFIADPDQYTWKPLTPTKPNSEATKAASAAYRATKGS